VLSGVCGADSDPKFIGHRLYSLLPFCSITVFSNRPDLRVEKSQMAAVDDFGGWLERAIIRPIPWFFGRHDAEAVLTLK
jgi:hypothetical protein